MPTINVGNLENQEKMLDYLTRIYGAVFDAAAVDWGTIFKSRETGRLFSTKFYNYSVTNTGIGELMNDSAGKTCEASTLNVEGQDDFQLVFVDKPDKSNQLRVTRAIERQNAHIRAPVVNLLAYRLEVGAVYDRKFAQLLAESPKRAVGICVAQICNLLRRTQLNVIII